MRRCVRGRRPLERRSISQSSGLTSSTSSSASSSSQTSLSPRGSSPSSASLDESQSRGRTTVVGVIVGRVRRRLSVAQRGASQKRQGRPREGNQKRPKEQSLASSSKGRNSDKREQDQLTLNDRLKLAELSANKLFRKVELSPQRQLTSTSSPPSSWPAKANHWPQVVAGRQQQQQQRSRPGSRQGPQLLQNDADEEDCDDDNNNNGASNDNNNNNSNIDLADDDNGDPDGEQPDDLSLLLRSVDRQLGAGASDPTSAGRLAPSADCAAEDRWCEANQRHQEEPPAARQDSLARAKSALGGVSLDASRAARVLRRAITLRSFARNLSRRTSSCEAPAGPNSTSGAQANPPDPRRASQRAAGTCSHLLSVASAEVRAHQQRRSAECPLAAGGPSMASCNWTSASRPDSTDLSEGAQAQQLAAPTQSQFQSQVQSRGQGQRRRPDMAAVRRRAARLFRRSKGQPAAGQKWALSPTDATDDQSPEASPQLTANGGGNNNGNRSRNNIGDAPADERTRQLARMKSGE